MEQEFNPGEVVYVMYRNPHIQDVVNIQEAAVVEHPEEEGELGLFVFETYYPLSADFAIYNSEEEAMQAYEEYFGSPGDEGSDG